VHINGSGSTEVVIPPHLAEKLIASENLTRMVCEIPQKLEFFEGQVKVFAIDLCAIA